MHTPQTSAVLAETVSRLRTAFGRKPIDPCVLKEAVCAYAEAVKKSGGTVERSIVEIKRIAEAGMGSLEFSDQRRAMKNDPADPVGQAVTWAIECFFAGKS